MDKILSHADSLAGDVAGKQGGTNRNAGPDTSSNPKASGDAVTNPSFYTRQDNSKGDDSVGTKNKFLDV